MLMTLLTAPVLPALALLAFAQAPQDDAVQTPQSSTTEAREAEPETERVCRYVKRTGSTMQQRVCSDEPRQRVTGNVHSMMEAREMLRRRQGSRIPDGS